MQSLKWWQKAVFYQIYPRSFADGNQDGIGDLKGILDKLDYLQWLGVDAIWLSPHFPSPQVDWGYDVSDYLGVAPEYGTLEDMRALIAGLHERGMRLVLDLVLNHTSDRHAWFEESRSSKDNPRRDWYVWKQGKNGNPPNDWYSTFGGSAWQLDQATGEYYYHFFFKEQPDLNWSNPAVKEAMFDAVRYWLDMGIDGFRLDAIGTIFEDPAYEDQACGFSQDDLYKRSRLARTDEEREQNTLLWEKMFRYQHDMPEVHDLMRDLRALVDGYEDRVLIGETDDLKFYGTGLDELHLVFNFPLMRTGRITAAWVSENQRVQLAAIPMESWPCNTLGNHDCARVYSQFGDGVADVVIARNNLALLLTLKGTPFLYNGEEIGMTDFHDLFPEQFRDPLTNRAYRLEIDLIGSSPEQAAILASREGRDKCRTPLQWKNDANGGFCPAEVSPWLPVNPNYAQGVNVAEQIEQPDSLLNFYRRMLNLRKRTPALIDGDYARVEAHNPEVLAFLRRNATQACLVLINFSGSSQKIQLGPELTSIGTIYTNRHEKNAAVSGEMAMEPYEFRLEFVK